MPSSWSASLRFELQFTGENINLWGDKLNVVLQHADYAVAGWLTKALSGNYTLTTANAGDDEARAAMLKFTGAGPFTVTIPSVSKSYLVWNACSAALMITTGAGASLTLQAGERALIGCDSSNVYRFQGTDFGGTRITSVADPSNPQDVATKAYVDSTAWSTMGGVLPGQAGSAGKFLTTDGVTAGWGDLLVGTIPGSFKLSGVITPAALTADQNNWNPAGLATVSVIKASATASRVITGLAGGTDGRLLILENVGSYTIYLMPENASSAAANRFATPASRIRLQPNHVALLKYDGTAARWRVQAFNGADIQDIRTGTATDVGITPGDLVGSAAFVPLPDTATVAWDVNQGYNATVTLGGNRNIGAPSGLQDGVTYTLNLVQDAVGNRVPTWNAIWDFGAYGAPLLQTMAGKTDKVTAQYNAARNKLEATFWRGA